MGWFDKPKPPPEVDYETLLRSHEELRDILSGLVAGLVNDGFSDEQAREIVMNIVVRRND